MKHTPRKRFGQNFLKDEAVIAAIIRAIQPQAVDNLVEIGPGLGALTTPLCQRLPRLHAIELDRDLIQQLAARFGAQLILHQGDALEFDFSALGANLRVVGNLPYNIATPLLFHLLQHADAIADMHFMLQKEVAERLCARPGSSSYGRLTIMLQYRCQAELLLAVPAAAFAPAPKVDSAFVRLIPRPAAELRAHNADVFAQVVRLAFAQRRKMLRNTLNSLFAPEQLAALSIDAQIRAEELAVADFVLLANALGIAASQHEE